MGSLEIRDLQAIILLKIPSPDTLLVSRPAASVLLLLMSFIMVEPGSAALLEQQHSDDESG